MTYEEYWERDPYLIKDYVKAHELKNEQKNQEMWLNGFYTLEALSVVLNNAFKKSGSAAVSYPDKPYPITTAQLQAEKERKAVEAANSFRAFATMKNYERKKE